MRKKMTMETHTIMAVSGRQNFIARQENHCFFFILHVGLPPPSVDVIEILKKPKLYHKPLYGQVATKSKLYNELEAFCKAMGWTHKDGMVPKKPVEEKKNMRDQWQEEDIIDTTDVHEHLTKTNVKAELANCCTRGIENKRAIEVLSDRKSAKLRKVIIIFFLSEYRMHSKFKEPNTPRVSIQ